MMTETIAEIRPSHPDRIVVETSFVYKDLVKAVPGARWDSEAKVWTVPLAWTSALALRAEYGESLRLGPKLAVWGATVAPIKKDLLANRNALVNMSVANPEKPGWEELYGYQVMGAHLIGTAGSYILFDETGTGKSRTALAALSLLEDEGKNVFPVLIAAPKSMLRTWAVEIDGFFPDASVSIVDGTPTRVKKALAEEADFYIISYDTARLQSRHAAFPTIALKPKDKETGPLNDIDFQTIIADEIHRIKNPKSQRTRAMWFLGFDTKYRIGLTGTPVQDTPEDLWSLLRFIAPDEYPVKTGFLNRYTEMQFNQWGGREIKGIHPSNRDEFFANLDTRTRRITKEVALPFLPPKVFETRWVALPTKHRKMYDEMETRMIATTIDGEDVVAVGSVLEKAGRLVQLANAAGKVDEDGVFHMDAENSPKVDTFMADVIEGDYDDQQVVVFSDSRQLVNVLEAKMTKAKLDFVTITGSVTGEARQNAMDIFQSGGAQFMILTRAGGEGITLTAASTMVRLVRSWSYTVHTQAEDRVHRIGSEEHSVINYIDYVTEDTVEEGQMARLFSKEKRAQEVLRDADLKAMIAERRS